MDKLEYDVTLDITRDSDFELALNSKRNQCAESKTVPITSREQYMREYDIFIKWRIENNIGKSFSEATFLQYFKELKQKTTFKPSSLLHKYSVLNTTIAALHNINIYSYKQLKVFINKIAASIQKNRKDVKFFTLQQLEKFLSEAPDKKYLAIKVALIFAISSGSGSVGDLVQIKIEDVTKQGNMYLVQLPKTPFKRRSNTGNTFVIRENLSPLIQSYIEMRPKNTTINRFFMSYKNGKFISQVMGKNLFCSFPKKIATYLNLPNPKEYSGRSFNKTSKILRSNYGSHLGLQASRVADQIQKCDIDLMDSIDAEDLLDACLEEPTPPTSNPAISNLGHQNGQRIKEEITHLLNNDTFDEITIEPQEDQSTGFDDIVCKEEPDEHEPDVYWDEPSTSDYHSNKTKHANGPIKGDPLANNKKPEIPTQKEQSQTDDDSDDDRPLAKIRELPSEMLLKTVMEVTKYDRERDRQWLEIERDRLRQRDAELQIQGKWLDLMKVGLRVLEKHLDKKRST